MTRERTRRRRALALALLAGLGAAGLWAAAHVPPRGELAARVLGGWLGRPVEVARVDVRIHSGLELELSGVRVSAGTEAGSDAPPLLEIERARGRQSWPRLLAGQLVPLSWELVGPVLRLRRGSTGGGELSIPELDLAVSAGRIEWQRDAGKPLVARDLVLQARRGSLATQARGRASAALYAGDTLLCSLDVDFQGWLDRGTVSGSVADLDLAQLPLGSFPLRGRATGRFALRRAPGETQLDIETAVERLELAAPRLHVALRPGVSRVDARASFHRGVIDVELERLELDDLDARGSVSVDPRPGGRTSGEITLASFAPGPSQRLHPVHVLAAFAQSWERRNERISAGRIHDARLRWNVATARLADTLAFERAPAADELEIRLRAEGGSYRVSDEDTQPLEDISGELEIRGNELHVANLRLRHGSTWLPQLDIRVDGMNRLVHLPEEERYVTTGPRVDLPGLTPLFRELSQREGNGDRTTLVRLRNADLYYPPAILPVRDARGRLVQQGPRIDVALERAVVGGVPAAVDVSWNGEARSLGVHLRYEGGDAPPRAAPPHWLAASVEMDRLDVATWSFSDVAGRISVIDDRVDLGAVQGRLAGGPFTARGEISLARADSAPYWLEFEGSGMNASDLAGHLDLEPKDVVGTLSGKGRLAGELTPDASFLASAELESDLELGDGHLGGLPALIAIARLPSLRGAPRALLGRPLDYRTASGRVAIADGLLTLSEGKLDGPDLRLLADGQIQLDDARRPRDFLITLLFLRTVDELIAQVPFLGTFVLGKNENLLGASFRVQGPRDDTRVTPVPPEALTNATQWATGVISNGARRLGRLIRILPPRGAKEPTSDDTAADTRAKQDPGPP
jgi:hypothetical protein